MFYREALAKINAKLDMVLSIIQKEEKLMALLDDDITALQAEVAADTVAENAAIKLINGIQAQIETAVAAANAAGATPAQLKAITDLGATLTANTTALAAAVAANTPAATAPTV